MRIVAALLAAILVCTGFLGCGRKAPVTILLTSDVRARLHPAG